MSGQELDAKNFRGAPGEVLAQVREATGISQREVADVLHLPINTIKAIEADDRASLPAHVFTRGYIRAYAKLLELDPDPLVAAITIEGQQGEDGEDTEPVERQPDTGLTWPAFDLSSLKQPHTMVVAAGVLVALVLIWGLSGSDEEDNVETFASQEENLIEAAEQNPSGENSDTALTQQPAKLQQPLAQSDLPIDTTTAPAPVVDAGILPRAVTATLDSGILTPVGDGGSLRRLTPLGEERLSIEFTEECWVEIKDIAGVTLFGDLGRSGQQIEFVGAGPFRILLGYAPGVLLKYNAEPIALAPHTRNNVASLVLGQ